MKTEILTGRFAYFWHGCLCAAIATSCGQMAKLPDRASVVFTTPTGGQVECLTPPVDVLNKSTNAEAELAVYKIGEIFKAEGGIHLDPQRIRQDVMPHVANWEVIDYRICAQYARGVLTAEDYRAFTKEILPILQRSEPMASTEAEISAVGSRPSNGTKKAAQQASSAPVRSPNQSSTPRSQRSSDSVSSEDLSSSQGGGEALSGNYRATSFSDLNRGIEDCQRVSEMLAPVAIGHQLRTEIKDSLRRQKRATGTQPSEEILESETEQRAQHILQNVEIVDFRIDEKKHVCSSTAVMRKTSMP